MQCPRCGDNNQSTNANYCTNCRAPLKATTLATLTQVRHSPPTNGTTAPQPVYGGSQAPIGNSNQPSASVYLNHAQGRSLGQGQGEDLVLVLDTSGSMAGRYDGSRDKITAAKRGTSSLVLNMAMIDPNAQIGIVRFDRSATPLLPLCPLHSHRDQMIHTIQSLQADGGTDQNEGLKAARDMFEWSRIDVTRRIIMLTDGEGGNPLLTAADLKSRGVIIEVLGVGDCPTNVNEKLLRKVASTINGENRYRFIKDAQTLVERLTQLGGSFQSIAAGS